LGGTFKLEQHFRRTNQMFKKNYEMFLGVVYNFEAWFEYVKNQT
jgi:hypothetical protein